MEVMEMELKPGEKYLLLSIGGKEGVKIPFFAKKAKNGQVYYSATLDIFVNEKKAETTEQKGGL